MKTPNWFKIVWWLVLLGITTVTLILRYKDITSGNSVPFDVVVLLIWVAIMLAPIFQEVSILGVKLKQSIDELKNQVNEVKNEIHNKITFNPTINLTPSADNKIQELEQKYSKLLDKILETKGRKAEIETISYLNVPDSNQFLFATRFRIENELRRIWESTIGDVERRRRTSLIQLLQDLTENQIINKNIYGALREVIAISNYGIHGEDISDNQIGFVKDIAPKLIATLEEIQ